MFTGISSINPTMPWHSLLTNQPSWQSPLDSHFSSVPGAPNVNPTMSWQSDDPLNFVDDSNLNDSNLDYPTLPPWQPAANPYGSLNQTRGERRLRQFGTRLEKSNMRRKPPVLGYINGPKLTESTASDLAEGNLRMSPLRMSREAIRRRNNQRSLVLL
jgi:hypothetical protein